MRITTRVTVPTIGITTDTFADTSIGANTIVGGTVRTNERNTMATTEIIMVSLVDPIATMTDTTAEATGIDADTRSHRRHMSLAMVTTNSLIKGP